MPKYMHLCIIEKLVEKNLHQCGKGHHILFVIFSSRQKFSVLPMRADGKIGEIFLLAKIYTYMYTVHCFTVATWLFSLHV